MDRSLFIKSLYEFRKRFETDHSTALLEQTERERLALYVQSFTQNRLKEMSEEDLFNYLSPLWAMAMWGNKHYQIDNIIEANGMELLRKQFSNLIYGSASMGRRWDEFRSKVKSVGPAIMSELLCKTYPEQFLLWNRRTYRAFLQLQVPNLPRYEAKLTGKTYAYLSSKGREMVDIAKENGFTEVSDMLRLNSLLWDTYQCTDNSTSDTEKDEDFAPQGKKEALFIHNDIRDKLADIGRFLGFRAEVEKKVAAGAVVDTIWEVTIGNMGRVIYVFEVQTSGSIDSLILNLIRAKNNKVVQGIVAVSDQKQLEKIKKEIAEMREIKDDIKFWDYTDVLRTYESLQSVNESINNLELVPRGL